MIFVHLLVNDNHTISILQSVVSLVYTPNVRDRLL
jgi:hypothetical protein